MHGSPALFACGSALAAAAAAGALLLSQARRFLLSPLPALVAWGRATAGAAAPELRQRAGSRMARSQWREPPALRHRLRLVDRAGVHGTAASLCFTVGGRGGRHANRGLLAVGVVTNEGDDAATTVPAIARAGEGWRNDGGGHSPRRATSERARLCCPRQSAAALVAGRRLDLVHRPAVRARRQGQCRAAGVAEFRVRRVAVIAVLHLVSAMVIPA